MIFFKTSKIRTLEKTLKMLASFQAVPLDNEKFVYQYRHIFALIAILKKDSSNVR